ncbi:MAG TPA: GNAT family N-acetyltransferase [Candidatus Acidoferrum sp.]|jgi:ribosomal protein S18 acetylase RimI-like enzyme|nr:GNAT family N-acetyltransferase [Candidatus Acidoferrum sp.]
MRIEHLGPGDEEKLAAAEGLLDGPVKPDAAHHFLGDPNHHMLVAYVDGLPAGFVSGVEMTHPDKGTEMFLYELGVDEAHRRKGVATGLVEALKALARERGNYGMWVLSDDDNEAALKTYRRVGGSDSSPTLFDWQFDTD